MNLPQAVTEPVTTSIPLKDYAKYVTKHTKSERGIIVADLQKYVDDKSANRKKEYLKMISDQEADLSNMITQANKQTQKMLEDFMAIDPFPQERIDKMQETLKMEIKTEIYNMSPLLRKRQSTSNDSEEDDLKQTLGSGGEGSGDIAV